MTETVAGLDRADWRGEVDFEALAEVMPALVFVTDALGRNLYTNAQFQRFTGTAAERLLGDGWLATLHPDDRVRAATIWTTAVTTSEPYEAEYRFRAADGAYRWHLCRGRPVREDGAIVRWVGICTDIDDQRAGAALAAVGGPWTDLGPDAEARFHALVETMPALVFAVGDGGDAYVSRQFAAFVGLSRIDLIGTGWRRIVHPDDVPLAETRALRSRATGLGFDAELRIRRADGAWRWHLVRCAPVGRPEVTRRWLGAMVDIHDRREAEEALRQSRELLTVVLSGVDGIVFAKDLDGRYLLTNEAARRVHGRGPEETIGLTDMDLFPPDVAAELRANDAAVIASGASVTFEERTELDGETVIYRSTKSPLRDAEGRAVGLVGVSMDITRLKAAEAALADSEARFRTIAEAVPQIVWSTLPDGFHDYYNARWYEYIGVSPGATDGKRWGSIVHIDDQAPSWALWQHSLASGEPYEVEYRLRHRSGAYRWTLGRAMPIRDAEGRIVRWMGTCTDIHDLVEARRAAGEREAQLAAMLDALPVAVAVADADGRIVRDNAAYRQLWFPDAGGASIGQWPETGEPLRDDECPLARTLATGQQVNGELMDVVDPHTRTCRTVLSSAALVRDGQDDTIGGVIVQLDITPLRDAEARLRQSQAELAALNADLERVVAVRTEELARTNQRLRDEIARREATQAALLQSQKLEALGQMVAGVAHDFNNVVQAVAGGYALIERRSSDPRVVDIARHGVGAARRGGDLVKQLLAFARQQALAPRTVPLAALLTETESLLQRAAGPGIAVTLDCPADLPPVRIDPTLLETALINLTVNGRDAMPGGGRLSITARVCADEDAARPPELGDTPAVTISVADTGCGMAPDILQRVLEPFFTTKGVGKGTGLGLAMVHGFVRQSGGALRIASREGEGTVITLYLPQATALDDAAAATVPAADATATAFLRVLVVEDDENVRSVTCALLADMGHQVTATDGAAAALAAFASQPIDIVVCDVMMPDTDGLALARLLRARRPDMPVLFVTGRVDPARLAGEHVLDKPFTGPELAKAMARAMHPGPLPV